MDYTIHSVESSEPTVPPRELDLIGFEFLSLTQDENKPSWAPGPPPPPVWGGARPPCGEIGRTFANRTKDCEGYRKMHMSQDRSMIWYTPSDYNFHDGRGPTAPSQTFAYDDCYQDGIDGDMGGCDDVKTGTLDRNAPASELGCFEGPRSRLAVGPHRGNIAAGWSSDNRTGVSLISSLKNKGWQSGRRHYDVPTRCQIFSFSTRPITLGTRCGSALPFAVRVGFFTDLTEDGKVDTDDVYLYNRRQYPDADPSYYETLVFKLGLDYKSYYGAPCEPPSLTPSGVCDVSPAAVCPQFKCHFAHPCSKPLCLFCRLWRMRWLCTASSHVQSVA